MHILNILAPVRMIRDEDADQLLDGIYADKEIDRASVVDTPHFTVM